MSTSKSRKPGTKVSRLQTQSRRFVKEYGANVAVQLFIEAVQHRVTYSTYVGDDDTTTESRLKALVNYDIEKWSEINHACHTLGSRLYSAKKVNGLTPAVIGYIQKCFTYCIKQNKGQPSSLLEGLSVIVPHAFGDHSKCKDSWCKYSGDPENYRHNDLPGGKDLKGDDLRACIEDALLSRFSVKKLLRRWPQ